MVSEREWEAEMKQQFDIGYRKGLGAALDWAFLNRPEGVPGGWLATAIKHLEATGQLPGDDDGP
jgi:hypothetical protein